MTRAGLSRKEFVLDGLWMLKVCRTDKPRGFAEEDLCTLDALRFWHWLQS